MNSVIEAHQTYLEFHPHIRLESTIGMRMTTTRSKALDDELDRQAKIVTDNYRAMRDIKIIDGLIKSSI